MALNSAPLRVWCSRQGGARMRLQMLPLFHLAPRTRNPRPVPRGKCECRGQGEAAGASSGCESFEEGPSRVHV
eukprot:COSAG02_NODE_23_length_52893_cov_58.101868_4_plen_73_part_00